MMEPPPSPPSREASGGSDDSGSSGTPSSTSTSSPIPLAAAAPPGLTSAAALAAALLRALSPFFQHLACHEFQPAVDELLALKSARQQQEQQVLLPRAQLDVLDNVLSPFLLLAAAEKMHNAPRSLNSGSSSNSPSSSLAESCQGPLPMYQEVTRDVGTLLQLFGRARHTHDADPALDRLRRALAAVLAALRLRLVLCRWFLAHAQRPLHPRPEEQEVLLRLLLLQEMMMTQQQQQQQQTGAGGGGGAAAGQSPPTLARLASGGSGVSAASLSSPASTPGLAPPPLLLPPAAGAGAGAAGAPFLPSPKGAAAASAAALLLDPQEAVEVIVEEVESVRERLAECGDGDDGEGKGEGAGALRAWAEMAVLEAEVLLAGLHATEALNVRPALLPAVTALLRLRRGLRRLERAHLAMHLDACLLPDEDEVTGEEEGGDEGEAHHQHHHHAGGGWQLGVPRLRALRRWLAHLVAKLPLRFHAVGPAVMGAGAYQHRLLGLPLSSGGRGDAGGGASSAAYVRMVARFLATYCPTQAVCVAVVMRGGTGVTGGGGGTGGGAHPHRAAVGYALPPGAGGGEGGEREEAGAGAYAYVPVFCMTALEAVTGHTSAPPAPAAPATAAAMGPSGSALVDASTHSVLSTSSHNWHYHRQQPATVAGGNSLDVSLSGLAGGAATAHAQAAMGGGAASASASAAAAAAATKAPTGVPPPYWAGFWGSGIEPALQGLPEGGDRYLLLPKEEDEPEELDGVAEEDSGGGRSAAGPLGAAPFTTTTPAAGGGGGSGLRSLFLPPGLFRRLSPTDDDGGGGGGFWARAKSPGRRQGDGEAAQPPAPPQMQRQRSRSRSRSRTPDRRQRPRRRRTVVPLPPLPEAEAAAALAGTFVHQNGARWRAGSSNVAQPQFAYYVAPVSGSEALVVLFADRSRPAADGPVLAFIRAMVAVLADRAVFASGAAEV